MSIRTLHPRALPVHPLLRPISTTFLPTIHKGPNPRPYHSTTVPESLTASRTLQYPALKIFDIVADIPSYPSFIPFCTKATVDATSQPDEHFQRTWPERATLKVGYGDQFNESFTSTVYCQPPIPEKGRSGLGIIEALSGTATTSIDPSTIKHHTSAAKSGPDSNPEAGPLEYLKCRWQIREFPYKQPPKDGRTPNQAQVETNEQDEKNTGMSKMTDVNLSIEYRFRNPVYEMMGKAVTGRMADRMIDAFVKRVESVEGAKVDVSDGDSVGLGDHHGKA